jgi:outer membrane protein OmpA-like peptidoglycan-associated protein
MIDSGMETGAMRTRFEIVLLAALIGTAGPLVGGSGPAQADEVLSASPTAEDFIKALTPQPVVKTRGIRHSGDAVAETREQDRAEPAYVDVPMITFEYNSAELTPRAREVLDQLAIALQSEQLASGRFLIEGHTDAVGSEDYNRALSEERARAAREYLAAKQIGEVLLETVGRGEDELLEDVPRRSIAGYGW